MTYLLLAYAIAALIFFVIALRGGKTYDIKTVVAMLVFSTVWPIVLIVFYLSDRD